MSYEVINLEQGSPEWLKWRKSHCMASETPVLFDCGYYGLKELAQIKFNNKEQYQSEAMRKGLEAEPIIREFAQDLVPYNFEPTVIKKGKFGASLDGFDENLGVIAEYKNSTSGFDMLKNEKVSDTYFYQIQHQLMVSGADVAYLFVRNPVTGDILWKMIEPKIEIFTQIKAKWTKFINEKDKYLEIIKDDSDEAIKLSDELDEIIEKKKELEAREKEIKALFDEMANGKDMSIGNYSVSYSSRKTTDYKGFLALKGLEVSSDFISQTQTTTIRRNR